MSSAVIGVAVRGTPVFLTQGFRPFFLAAGLWATAALTLWIVMFATGAALPPSLITPYAGSPKIFFGTILVFVSIGAFIPVLFVRETIGQLDTFTEAVPEPA
jgi:uncharacterized protein involved in response to NO